MTQALGLVFTLATSYPEVQAAVLTLQCSLFMVVHLLVQPMAHPESNNLQTALLACLTGLALSGTPLAASLGGVTAMEGERARASASLVQGMQTAFGIVVPILAVVLAYKEGLLALARRLAVCLRGAAGFG